jgi:hypothetical protein
MSKRQRTPTNPSIPNPTRPAVPADLGDLLDAVESRCNHAAGIVNVTARAIAGDELTLQDEDVPTVFAAALERVAGELEALGDRALRARTGKGAAE